MNIFVVDEDPVKAAIMLPDKLVVKMAVETAQILSTVFRQKFPDRDAGNLYRKTHENHPVTKWAGTHKQNFIWLYLHGMAICKEYTKRYKRKHACEDIIKECWTRFNPNTRFILSECTPFAQCMPKQYKESNAVKAYRKYMINEKHYAKWNHGPRPDWWIND